MVMAVLEGVAMSFVLLIICVVGIANGPVGMVFFYEKEVQDKAIERLYCSSCTTAFGCAAYGLHCERCTGL